MNSKIKFYPTKSKSFDGSKKELFLMDEIAHYQDPEFADWCFKQKTLARKTYEGNGKQDLKVTK